MWLFTLTQKQNVKLFADGVKLSGFVKKKRSAKLRNKLPKKKKMVKKFKVGSFSILFFAI